MCHEEWVKTLMNKWIQSRADVPYPNEQEKMELQQQTGITRKQLDQYFSNYRKRKTVHRRRARFKYESRVVLTKWVNDHIDHPYPMPSEYEQLEFTSGLNEKQLRTWLTNYRKRHKEELGVQESVTGANVSSE